MKLALETQCSREMPRYECHKQVWALKIKAVLAGENQTKWVIVPAEEGYGPFEVSGAYVAKHLPEAGGYYVVYADGYASFSPATAFEIGYTRISS